MPNNKNILREKINEACPELLKLEFGCEVETLEEIAGAGSIVFRKSVGKNLGGTNYLFEHSQMFGVSENGFEWERGLKRQYASLLESQVKILGKPPTLEHLLRTPNDSTTISNEGVVCTTNHEPFIYDLTKTPLEQSEEVIEALLKIIK